MSTSVWGISQHGAGVSSPTCLKHLEMKYVMLQECQKFFHIVEKLRDNTNRLNESDHTSDFQRGSAKRNI